MSWWVWALFLPYLAFVEFHVFLVLVTGAQRMGAAMIKWLNEQIDKPDIKPTLRQKVTAIRAAEAAFAAQEALDARQKVYTLQKAALHQDMLEKLRHAPVGGSGLPDPPRPPRNVLVQGNIHGRRRAGPNRGAR